MVAVPAMVGDTLSVGSPEALEACLTDLFAVAGVFVVGGDVANAGVQPGPDVDPADASQLGVEDSRVGELFEVRPLPLTCPKRDSIQAWSVGVCGRPRR